MPKQLKIWRYAAYGAQAQWSHRSHPLTEGQDFHAILEARGFDRIPFAQWGAPEVLCATAYPANGMPAENEFFVVIEDAVQRCWYVECADLPSMLAFVARALAVICRASVDTAYFAMDSGVHSVETKELAPVLAFSNPAKKS
jgi:hypothetical protein